jgi:hypothetical protein
MYVYKRMFLPNAVIQGDPREPDIF